MYKRILVAYNAASDRALHESVVLAKDQKAQLKIVYVLDPVHSTLGLEYIDLGLLQKEQREAAKKLLAKANKYLAESHIVAETKIIELTALNDTIAERITEEAEKWSADLLVLGTKGSSGIKRLLLGSVAEGVMRHATGNYSLLLVKESAANPPSKPSKKQSVKPAKPVEDK